jgi:hypothetical protein
VITIERTPWTVTSATELYSTTNAAWCGSTAISGAAGDIAGDASLYIKHSSDISQVNYVVGAASVNLHGTRGTSSHFGLHDAAGETMGTDTSSVVDANAITGNAAQCTFATVSTQSTRVTYTTQEPTRRFRVYVRARVTAAASCDVLVSFNQTHAHGYQDTRTATISSTTYAWYDLGAISADHTSYAEFNSLFADDIVYITVIASRSSGAGYLNIDSLYFMPLESFVYGNPSSTFLGHSSRFGRNTMADVHSTRGLFRVPRGDFTLYWLLANYVWQLYQTSGTTIKLYHYPRYLTARGAV